jgi:predicted glycosyltransferase
MGRPEERENLNCQPVVGKPLNSSLSTCPLGENRGTDGDPVCVMAYSHDGYGLGHLRRNTNIASCFIRHRPDSNVLLLVGCSVGAFFGSQAGVDFIKVPSIVKAATEVWRPLNLRISQEKMKSLRTSMIQNAAEAFKPDLFLVDHVPTGVWAELLPTLQMLREREDPPRTVLGLRDIINAPDAVRELWGREDIYRAIRNYYDEILIYGCRSVFSTASQYGLDVEFPGKITYCGYVCSEEPYKTRKQMREELEIRKDKFVVVTAGGGRDGYPILQACLDALQLLGKDPPFEVILIAGPLMDPDEKACLQRQADGLRVRMLSHVFDNLSYMNAADLVITMAGYNSLCEILRLKKKSLVLPRAGPSAEQIMRAKYFAQRGLIDVIYPHQLSPRSLAERLIADLERDDYPACDEAVELDGAAHAAVSLSELLGRRVYGSAA